MIRALLLAAAVATAPLSPETRALIAPIHEAVVKARAELAAMPPPKDDTEKLVRMMKLDQAPRQALTIDFSKIPESERRAARAAINDELRPIDEANLAALLGMLPPKGWFTIGKYGRGGSKAAFLIVQHANPEQWRRFMPVLEPLAAKGEVSGDDYALMYDRLALSEQRPQRYGSQMTCQAGRFAPAPTEDLDHIDERRAALHMGPYKDYLALYASAPPC